MRHTLKRTKGMIKMSAAGVILLGRGATGTKREKMCKYLKSLGSLGKNGQRGKLEQL